MNFELLKRLMETIGASGHEQQVRELIYKEIKKYVKDVTIDKFGNLIAHKKGNGPMVMLAAHMDEIGLMIKSISERGTIYCSDIGGMNAISLIGRKVAIKTKNGIIHGVVTTADVSDDEELTALPAISDLVVDTGLTKKELTARGVDIGSYLELVQDTRILGSKDIIAGKAVDDRVGCYVLIELARILQKTKLDIYFVFTVQEEVGLYGSKTSLQNINPEWAVVVDVTSADDAKQHSHEITKQLGKGPCVTVKDSDMVANICIDDWLKDIARKNKIPIQLEVTDVGTTDALSISVSKGGIPTAVVGVAVRNLHTTFGMVSLSDIENCIKLTAELLKAHPQTCLV